MSPSESDYDFLRRYDYAQPLPVISEEAYAALWEDTKLPHLPQQQPHEHPHRH